MPPMRFEASETGADESHRSIVIPFGDKLTLVFQGLTLVETSGGFLELNTGGD